MSEIYSRFFSKRSHTKNYRLLISFIGIDIYLFINKEIVELLMLLTDETDIVSGSFHRRLSVVDTI